MKNNEKPEPEIKPILPEPKRENHPEVKPEKEQHANPEMPGLPVRPEEPTHPQKES
jgi:hypothetical protein